MSMISSTQLIRLLKVEQFDHVAPELPNIDPTYNALNFRHPVPNFVRLALSDKANNISVGIKTISDGPLSFWHCMAYLVDHKYQSSNWYVQKQLADDLSKKCQNRDLIASGLIASGLPDLLDLNMIICSESTEQIKYLSQKLASDTNKWIALLCDRARVWHILLYGNSLFWPIPPGMPSQVQVGRIKPRIKDLSNLASGSNGSKPAKISVKLKTGPI